MRLYESLRISLQLLLLLTLILARASYYRTVVCCVGRMSTWAEHNYLRVRQPTSTVLFHSLPVATHTPKCSSSEKENQQVREKEEKKSVLFCRRQQTTVVFDHQRWFCYHGIHNVMWITTRKGHLKVKQHLYHVDEGILPCECGPTLTSSFIKFSIHLSFIHPSIHRSSIQYPIGKNVVETNLDETRVGDPWGFLSLYPQCFSFRKSMEPIF
jgi:hypothetical protein